MSGQVAATQVDGTHTVSDAAGVYISNSHDQTASELQGTQHAFGLVRKETAFATWSSRSGALSEVSPLAVSAGRLGAPADSMAATSAAASAAVAMSRHQAAYCWHATLQRKQRLLDKLLEACARGEALRH